jgi:hypothetical protein
MTQHVAHRHSDDVHQASMAESQSLGAQRVRESFNPSRDGMVDKLKRYTADLIDLCEDLKRLDPRLAALAQTAYEEAAMWAVKAATATPNPAPATPPEGATS